MILKIRRAKNILLKVECYKKKTYIIKYISTTLSLLHKMQMKCFHEMQTGISKFLWLFLWLILFYLFPVHKHTHLMLKFETTALLKSLLIYYGGKWVLSSREQMVNNLI